MDTKRTRTWSLSQHQSQNLISLRWPLGNRHAISVGMRVCVFRALAATWTPAQSQTYSLVSLVEGLFICRSLHSF